MGTFLDDMYIYDFDDPKLQYHNKTINDENISDIINMLQNGKVWLMTGRYAEVFVITQGQKRIAV